MCQPSVCRRDRQGIPKIKIALRLATHFFAQIAKANDSVWVHDYHLMLMPEMLRSTLDPQLRVKIGFFLHTPFPSSEIYRYVFLVFSSP